MARIELKAEVTGKVWKIEAPVGSKMAAFDTVMVIESMKMEIPVATQDAGEIVELRVGSGDAVEDGQVVAVLETRAQ